MTLDNISKLCSDHLREIYSSSENGKFKASHAREIVAAFFGYKTHSALLFDDSICNLECLRYVGKNKELIEKRLTKLNGLPKNLTNAEIIQEDLIKFLHTIM